MKKLTLEELKTARLKLLDETAKTYCSSNRSITSNKGDEICLYTPSNKSPGCAIGRKISKKLANKLDTFYPQGDSAVTNNDVFDSLPNNLKILGQSFLAAIQDLHDSENYWDENGLSSEGKFAVEEIKSNINSNSY